MHQRKTSSVLLSVAALAVALGCSASTTNRGTDPVEPEGEGGAGGGAAGGRGGSTPPAAGGSPGTGGAMAGTGGMTSAGTGGMTSAGAGGMTSAGGAGGAPRGGSGGGGADAAAPGDGGTGGGASSADARVPETPFPAAKVAMARPQQVAAVAGSGHNEGPSWRDGSVYWCDRGGVHRLDPQGKASLYMANDSCGATYAAGDGTLLLALGRYCVAQITKDGKVNQLCELPGGTGFANDITVDAAGNIYITNMPSQQVVRVTPAGDVAVVASNLKGANGLEVDPASKFLYVNLADQNRMVRLPIAADGAIGAPVPFGPTVGVPDGCAFDAWGNFWVGSFNADRITIFDPTGKELARLPSGGRNTTNLTFGGPSLDVVYATGAGTLRRIPVGVPGFRGHPGAASYKALKTLPFTVAP